MGSVGKAVVVFALGLSSSGCAWFSYYPHHEAAETRGDVQKGGPDSYGGNNGPAVNAPGVPDTSPATAPGAAAGRGPSSTVAPQSAATGASVREETGSYSGANTGGGMGGGPANVSTGATGSSAATPGR